MLGGHSASLEKIRQLHEDWMVVTVLHQNNGHEGGVPCIQGLHEIRKDGFVQQKGGAQSDENEQRKTLHAVK